MLSYRKIPNHFSFQDVYQLAVSEASENSIFVEIGTWLGASAAFMADCIRKSGKRIEFYAVDNFTAQGSGAILEDEVAKLGGCFYEIFCDNLKKCGVDHLVKSIVGDSTSVAEQFADQSLQFVYIDACHKYEKVLADIRAWLPKVRRGGIIAGHDFNKHHPDVVRAVRETFQERYVVMRHSWVVKL